MAVDPAFGLNNYGKPKMYSESETLANNILSVLFARPGSLPSMPNVGMYIQGIVFQHWDEVDAESLKSDLVQQCKHFKDVVQNGEFDVQKRILKDAEGKDRPVLLFIIPTQKKFTGRLAIAVVFGGNGISYNFQWID